MARDRTPTTDSLHLDKKTLRTLLDDELDLVAGGTFGGEYTGSEGGWNCWSPSFFGGGGSAGSDSAVNY